MKQHLRRFGWLYLTLFAVIAWPIFLIRQQAVPPPDVSTVRRLAQAIQTEFARQHPQSQVRAYTSRLKLEEPETGNSKNGVVESRLFDLLGGGAATEVMKPELAQVGKKYDGGLQRWDELTSSGVIYSHMLPAPTQKEPASIEGSQMVPNYLAIQTSGKIRRMEAEAAIREGRWNDALRLLESTARAGDPFRYSGVIGLLINIATRAIGYGGYTTLLHAGPPPEVERAALDALVRLRRGDPVFDEWAWLGERMYSYNYLIYLSETKPRERKDPSSRALSPEMIWRSGLFAAAASLALQRDRIKDPTLRARADALFKNVNARELMMGTLGGPHQPDGFKWTAVPATRKWLQAMIAREPWVRQEIFSREFKVLPAAVTAKLDPWTVIFLSGNGANANFLEANVRSQVAKTKGRLLEAAFAARLYQEKTGAWPKDMKDLAGYYPLSEDVPQPPRPLNELQFNTQAFLPLRIAELPQTDQLRDILWADVLPMRSFNTQPRDGRLKGEWTLDCIHFGPADEWVKEPVRVSALEEALRAHPELVKSVQAFQTHTLAPPEVDSGNGERYQWQIMKPDEARRLTDVNATQKAQESKMTPLMAVRLKAQLRAPAKAVVIWSPGPDGKDDHGQICYDPTNGTNSAGDLLVFPEKF